MNRGQKCSLAAGIAAAAFVVSFVLLSDEVRVRYYLYRLRSGSSEYLSTLMERPEGTPERQAVNRFVTSAAGKQQLLSLAVGDLDETLTGRRGLGRTGGEPPPSLKDYYPHALIGMRFRASKDVWVLWADMRRPGTTIRASLAAHTPTFASDRALAEAFEAMCRGTDPGEEIVVPGYPALRFRIEPFEDGLKRYEAILGAHGQSIENSAYWYETLEDWADMLKEGTLKPWVIRASVQPR